jgi:hypothetical protein
LVLNVSPNYGGLSWNLFLLFGLLVIKENSIEISSVRAKHWFCKNPEKRLHILSKNLEISQSFHILSTTLYDKRRDFHLLPTSGAF